MELWMPIFCLTNVILMVIVWIDILRRYLHRRDANQSKSMDKFKHLPLFRSFQSFNVIHLRQSTTLAMVEEILRQMRSARKFIIVTERNTDVDQNMLMYICASTSVESLVVGLDYLHERDDDTEYASILREIFDCIFRPYNWILTWGTHQLQLEQFLNFNLFTHDQLLEVQALDLQVKFHECFDRAMNDSNQKFNLCSCVRRQLCLQTPHSFSLSEAIAVCVHEHLPTDRIEFNQCLALEKLDNVMHDA